MSNVDVIKTKDEWSGDRGTVEFSVGKKVVSRIKMRVATPIDGDSVSDAVANASQANETKLSKMRGEWSKANKSRLINRMSAYRQLPRETAEAMATINGHTLPDDLTLIKGIGDGTQAELDALVIFTYEALIEADADMIAENVRGGVDDVIAWQKEAKKLVKK